MKKKIKAFALLSGGLDSTLAAKIVKDQGIQVEGINFSTGFCLNMHHKSFKKRKNEIFLNDASKSGERLGIPVDLIDISKEYINILLNPEYGYGTNVNPCIDCRIFMLKKARSLMDEKDASFIVTGEVVGQRPMSQFKQTLYLIEKESGLKGLILRPLSAKLLPKTIPEENGWINRDKLYDINGRSRKHQLKLARELGIKYFSQPAGGCCFLTDQNFARKFKDLINYKGKENITFKNLNLLKVGRHFRISNKTKIIVGRDEAENIYLECFSKGLMKLRTIDTAGPLTVVDGIPVNEEINLIAAITALYSDGKNENYVKIELIKDDKTEIIEVKPLDRNLIEKFRI
ncbi:MAG: hypothetical protein HWN67_20705 [Candidatus Helarchaeota archaeon]|nr:hypothetical protein [Candidatus Helarchaeota archaeon]